MLVNSFVIPLLLTMGIEAAVAYIAGYRNRQYQLAVAAVNALTNPAINLIAVLILYFGHPSWLYPVVLPLELVVIVAEWRILSYAMPAGQGFFRLSIMMNTCSFVLGLLIL